MDEFIAENLTYARSRKGLSMQDIADLLGVQRQYIHKIEKNKENKCLSAVQVNIIANKLGVDPGYFYQPIVKKVNLDHLHFRSIAIPNYVRSQAKIHVEDVVAAHSFLRDFISPLGLSFPEFELDEELNASETPTDRLCANEIENITQKIRSVLGLGDGPISNMTRLLEGLGIIVTTRSDLSEKVDAFCNDEHYPVIFLNNTKSAVRCRLDLGHELGHLILHRGVTNDIERNPYIEKQANHFAASLLLPRKSFVSEFPVIKNKRIPWARLIKLKQRWKVSLGALIYRAYHLQLIDADTYSKAFIHMASRGWKTKEPLDDPSDEGYISHEKTEFLENSINLLSNSYPDLLSKLADYLKMNGKLIKEILNLPTLDEKHFVNAETKIALIKNS